MMATGMRPASTSATAQRRQAEKKRVRQDGRQNRCGDPPVERGVNGRSHQRQVQVVIGVSDVRLCRTDQSICD
jgi:hypothetical protein